VSREQGRAEGSRKAAETFARQRARKCADELALIAPALWDEATRRIVLTLATLAAPSRVDDVLAQHMPLTWDDLPDGTDDIGEAFAAELDRMGLMTTTTYPPCGDQQFPPPAPYPTPRPRPDPDPRPNPEPHPQRSSDAR
jgi:hypothetical protein